MKNTRHEPTPKQVVTRDRLIGDGYKHEGWNEHPSLNRSKRNKGIPDACMVMRKHNYHERGYSSVTTQINPDGTTT